MSLSDSLSANTCCRPCLLTKSMTGLHKSLRVHYVCFDCYNISHFSSSLVIFICHMHSRRLAYCKAFDTINHLILFQKLRKLAIPPNVLLWIINLSGRTQSVSSFRQISGWLPVSRSIIQGSGIGPYLKPLPGV